MVCGEQDNKKGSVVSCSDAGGCAGGVWKRLLCQSKLCALRCKKTIDRLTQGKTDLREDSYGPGTRLPTLLMSVQAILYATFRL